MSAHGTDRLGLVSIGLGTVATACVPAVGSSIVVDETQTPERRHEPERTERKPALDQTAPQIVAAELAGNAKLRIHFSEPVVATEAFNPTDFRISMLRITSNGSYSNAYYYEPGNQYYGVPIVHTAARVDGNTVEIDFSTYLPQAFCRGLENQPSYSRSGESVAGLFLHYAAGPIPIRDEAGNPLSSFGVAWVMGGRQQPPEFQSTLEGEQATRAGTQLVRISCGPPIPPGPR